MCHVEKNRQFASENIQCVAGNETRKRKKERETARRRKNVKMQNQINVGEYIENASQLRASLKALFTCE